MEFNFIEVLKLFQDNPELMLIALVVLVIMIVAIKVLPKNKIGIVKAKKTTIEQSSSKGNIVDKIDSDKVKITQR